MSISGLLPMSEIVKKIINRFTKLLARGLQKNYYTAKFYNKWLTKKYVVGKQKLSPPLLVYSMPKVGTMSVMGSLEKETGLPVLHLHTLRKERLLELEKIYIENWDKNSNPKHLWHSFYFLDAFDTRKERNDKFKIITLVRDPVAQNISSFFEIIYLELDYNYNDKLKVMSVEEIVDELVPLFVNDFSRRSDSEDWFEQELKQIFDIDIYDEPFEYGKGYKIYKGQRADALLIRLENLSNCAKEAFENYFEFQNFSLIDKNVGLSKDYSSYIKDF